MTDRFLSRFGTFIAGFWVVFSSFPALALPGACPELQGLYELQILSQYGETKTSKVFVALSSTSTESRRDYLIYDRLSLDEVRISGGISFYIPTENEECAGIFDDGWNDQVIRSSSIRQSIEVADGKRYEVLSFAAGTYPTSEKLRIYRFLKAGS